MAGLVPATYSGTAAAPVSPHKPGDGYDNQNKARANNNT